MARSKPTVVVTRKLPDVVETRMMELFDVRLNAHGRAQFTFPEHHNVAFLVMSGEVTLNGTSEAAQHDFVVFGNDGTQITIEARSAAQVLVLSGEPIDEPVVQYGPFVMNSEREILDAFHDFNSGKFGELED